MNGKRFFLAVALVTSLALLPSAIATENSKAAGPSPTSAVNTILSGSSVPAKTLGINGDFYIDTKNLNLYGPKTKGVWKVTTSLRPKEPAAALVVVGDTGPAGTTGATGQQGDKGDKGITGEKGATGASGLQGATGFTGATGFIGATGFTGATGATGTTGAPGLKGETGTTGSQGIQGAKGDTGSQGIQGIKGDAGATGAKGETGTAGGTGAQGVAGISVAKFVTLPSATLAITTGDNATSQTFFTADTDGNYTFEVIVVGVVNSSDSFNLNAEIVVGNSAITNQFAIAASANSFANKISGRQYGFTVIGAVANVSAGAIFALRITNEFPVSGGTPIAFNGRALVNKVGSIG
jgi:hypothetical protein